MNGDNMTNLSRIEIHQHGKEESKEKIEKYSWSLGSQTDIATAYVIGLT